MIGGQEKVICDWCETETYESVERGVKCILCKRNLESCSECFTKCHPRDGSLSKKYSLRTGWNNHQKMYHESIELV